MKRIFALLLMLALFSSASLPVFSVSAVNPPPTADTREEQATGLWNALEGKLGSLDLENLISGIRQAIGDTSGLTDEELRAQIVSMASTLRVNLTETQIAQVISLLRSLEGMDADRITSFISGVKDTMDKVQDTAEKAIGIFQKLKSWVDSARNFFESLKDILGLS